MEIPTWEVEIKYFVGEGFDMLFFLLDYFIIVIWVITQGR